MSAEPAAVRILREALESALPVPEAAAVLFEGLASWGERIPVDAAELRSAVTGPVRHALLGRLSAVEAEALVTRIVGLLSTAEATTDLRGSLALRPTPISIDVDITDLDADDEATTAPRRQVFGDERITLRVPLRGGPVPVVVVAGTGGFATRLRLAVGPERVAPRAVREVSVARDVLSDASVVVVDATDIAPIDPEVLVGLLRALPSGCVPAVYGSDLPFGRRVAEALLSRGVRAVAVEHGEGIEPLIDLVRSRHT